MLRSLKHWGWLSGLLLALAYPNFSVSALAFLAFLPLLGALYSNADMRSAVWQSVAAGFVFFLMSCYGIAYVSVVGYVSLCVYLSLFFIPFGLAVQHLYHQKQSAILWGPLFWVAAEYLRGYLLSGFPWNTLASSQATFLPLIQMASVTGAYGVSFLVMMVNFLLFELWLSLRGKVLKGFQPFALGAVAMVIACLVFGHLELRKADAAAAVESLPIKVAAIQPNVPQEQKWDPAFRDEIASRLQRLTLEAAKAKPLLIVWPETSVPGEVRNDAPMTRFAQDLAKQTGCNLLIGSQDSSLDAKPGAVRKYYNAAVLVDAKGEMTQVYRKMHLVPFGEFLPFAKWFPFLRWFIPIPEDFSAGTEATVFQMPGNVFRWMDLDGTRRHVMDMRRFGVAICFEDTFSEPFRRLCYQKLAFMVNMTNDAWFQHSGIALQHANLAVFRAIENREPLLRSTNTGYTCLIDPYGRIQAQVKKDASIFVPGMLVAEIVPNFVKTIYSQMGDFVAQACLILALMKVFIWRRERRNK